MLIVSVTACGFRASHSVDADATGDPDGAPPDGGFTGDRQTYVKASDPFSGDRLGGYGVAVSADGRTLAAGAHMENSAATGIDGDQTDGSAVDSGAVYVYRSDGTTWTQQAYVKASNTDAGDQFGFVAALSADGNTLAVGAPEEDSNATGIDGDQGNNSSVRSGAVYVFTRDGETWTQQAYIKASNTAAGDWFGYGLALSGDGNTLAVGASDEDSNARGVGGDQGNNSAVQSGAVYVFTRLGTAWLQQAYLKASNTDSGDLFGGRLALSNDGSTLAVRARLEDSAATGVNGDEADNAAPESGAVYVFTRTAATWTQQAYLKASNTGIADGFGAHGVSLSGDGNTLAVGADLEDSAATGIDGDGADDTASSSGAAYVFARAGTTWTQQAYVKASNTGAADLFGHGLALSADGYTLAIGAPLENSGAIALDGDQADETAGDSGAVYLFTRAGATWTQRAYVKAFNTGSGDEFGLGLALSGDGGVLAIGAALEDSGSSGIGGDQANNSSANSGAVYVYE